MHLSDDMDQSNAEALAWHLRRRCPCGVMLRRDPCSNPCSNAAGFAAVRECSPLSESLALLTIRTLTNSDERAAEVWGSRAKPRPLCRVGVPIQRPQTPTGIGRSTKLLEHACCLRRRDLAAHVHVLGERRLGMSELVGDGTR